MYIVLDLTQPQNVSYKNVQIIYEMIIYGYFFI